jgi:NDP-sugar pyrophosphorylase family protein
MHNKQTVLITTSGVGSRLGNLTKYLNKSLIRVGNKFSICHIIDKYDLQTTQFVITVGHLGHLVKEFLDIAYTDNNFVYVTVDNYDQEGSSLAYSLLQAKNALQCPFTFYCCDSIVLDDITLTTDMTHNVLYVAQSDDSTSYATVNVSGNQVAKINSKGEKSFDYIYTGVSYIYNYAEYWNELERLYAAQSNNKELSDVHLMNIMISKGLPFHYKCLSRWYDIGNVKTFNEALQHIKCDYDVLHKDTESICFLKDKVVKFMCDTKSVKNRVTRGQLLAANAPQILHHNDHFFSMEYINGTVMSKYYVSGEIYKLLNWSYDNLWVNKMVDPTHITVCMNFYKNKTIQRIDLLDIQESKTINGMPVPPICELLESINWEALCTDTFYNFHGDFILDNIICTDSGSYKLIDWRQDFGGEITHGDMYYDLAKLRHNIIFNHDNINDNLYDVRAHNDDIVVDLKCNYFLVQQLEQYEKFILEKNLDIRKIKILTALIWLNMSPLHEYNVSKFLFHFGKYNLILALRDD